MQRIKYEVNRIYLGRTVNLEAIRMAHVLMLWKATMLKLREHKCRRSCYENMLIVVVHLRYFHISSCRDMSFL